MRTVTSLYGKKNEVFFESDSDFEFLIFVRNLAKLDTSRIVSIMNVIEAEKYLNLRGQDFLYESFKFGMDEVDIDNLFYALNRVGVVVDYEDVDKIIDVVEFISERGSRFRPSDIAIRYKDKK